MLSVEAVVDPGIEPRLSWETTGADADVTLKFGLVRENFAACEAGELWNQSGCRMSVIYSDIVDNTAAGDATDDGGGGVFNNGRTLCVVGSPFAKNDAIGANGS